MQLSKRINKDKIKKALILPKKPKINIDDKPIGLILSGGGARGAYQIGAWKAMEELNMVQQIVSVYGTSVGAINAASMAQGDFNQAHALWQDMNYSKIFDDYAAVEESAQYNPRAIYAVFRSLFKDRCLSIQPMKELLYHHLDEQAIRDSKVAFGLVTYNLTAKKRQYLSKDDIPEGELIDYVIASASLYPIFPAHEIAGHRYIDGGIADNRPVRFLNYSKDVKHALCIDLTSARHFWLKKAVRSDLVLDYIIPSKLLGSPLAFDPDRIDRNLRLGYMDFHEQINY